jgi:general secretion pathway protein A
MYLEFYGLKEPPLAITPDPRFVFLSERHRDALAHLLFGVGQGGSGGFVQLTGEVGTGKTTLSRLVLEQLPEKTRVALVLNPRLTPVELLETICEELRLDIGAARGSVKALVDALNHYLLDAYAQGLRVVLIIDEAQNLSVEALEQVRLLTNLETPTQKLLQIILLGQPELRELLDRPELRQLAQRVTARYHLTPLNEEETDAYLRHRLAVAGAARFPFTRLGVRALHARSGGVPRLINAIGERALLAGFVADEPQLGERLVHHAADELLGRTRRRVLRGALLSLFALGIAAVLVWAWQRGREPVVRAVPQPPATPTVAVAATRYDALDEAIDALPADAELSAWAHYLALWDVDAARVTVRDAARCPATIYPGLSCLRGGGSLTKLASFGRPVMLALHDVRGRAVLALLLALDEHSARLDLGTRTVRIARADLETAWLGEYFAVWKAPAFLSERIRLGDSGAEVTWVRQSLTAFDKLTVVEEGPAYFDAALQERVRRVQGQFGLLPDGVIGPETEFALSTRASGGPRLAQPSTHP